MTNPNLQTEFISPWVEPGAIAIVAIPSGTTCQHCQKPFQPRGSNGGQRQKYCSSTCRKAANNSRRSQQLNETSQRLTLKSNEDSQRLTETPQRLTNVSPTTHEALAPKDDDRFDWTHDGTMLEEQLPIAVYIGERGHLVIRQRADWPTEREDTLILISPSNIMWSSWTSSQTLRASPLLGGAREQA